MSHKLGNGESAVNACMLLGTLTDKWLLHITGKYWGKESIS